jgi:intergrase/recombinase
MTLMVVSGLRFEEGVESHNLIVRLAKEGKLNEYYDSERQILAHFKFKKIFIRRTKKAFMSFIPKALVETISNRQLLNKYSVQTKVKRKTHVLRFGDIREMHGTLLTKYLSESEIDFLHGRVSSSVFMRNYFNPALITDLKTRVFQGTCEIQSKT